MHAILFLIAAASAEPASPARRCAQAAQGSEIEVCLRLAVENPGAVEEIVSALVAHIDRTEGPERALLDALLLLLSDRREEGARVLGALDDPRVVPALLAAAAYGDDATSSAAIDALAAHVDAIDELRADLMDRDVPVERRLAIAQALGRSPFPTAADALQDALRRRMPASLRAAVVRALRASDPDRLAFDQQTPSADGALWLAGGTSAVLGYAMGAAGALGAADIIPDEDGGSLPLQLWMVGAATGAVGGASGGWLYARAFPIAAGDAAFISTSSAGGGLAGFLIGASVRTEAQRAGGDFSPALVGGLIGEAVALPAALLVQPRYDGTASDALEAMVLAGLLTVGTESVAQFLEDGGDDVPRAAITGGAIATGLVLGHALAPRVDVRQELPMVGLGAAAGLGAGLLIPVGDRPRSTLPVATGIVGAGVGGLLANSVLDWRPDVAFASLGGTLLGAGVGGGVGLLAAPEDETVGRALALGGATLGFVGGAALANLESDPIDDRDVVIALASSAWAAWDSVAVGVLVGDGRAGARGTGALLLASSLAGGGAIALKDLLDVPVPSTLSATSVGLWGGYAGAAVADLLDQDQIAFALPGSNLGLLGGAWLVSPRVGVPPLVIGVADTGGVLGASLCGIGAALLSGPGREKAVVGWSLGGAVVGLAGGAALGTAWYRSGARRDVALNLRLPSDAVVQFAPLAVRDGYGVSVQVAGW